VGQAPRVEDQAAEVKASLPGLPVGTAWVWSPGWLDVLARIKIRARTTFDSSATPKPGQKRVTPQRMTPVDLAELGQQITATVERAKADDPAVLRRRIRDLEQQLVQKPAPERVEVPIMDPQVAEQLEELLRPLTDQLNYLGGALSVLKDPKSRHAPTGDLVEEGRRLASQREDLIAAGANPADLAVPLAPAPPPRPRPRPLPNPVEPGSRGAPGLSKAQRKILTVLAQQGSRSTTQVAIMTGYSHKSGGYRNALSSLRSSGWIEGRGDITITGDGLDILGPWDPLPVGRDLLEWWKTQHLSKAEKAIVDVLVDHDGGPVDVATIAALTEYSASSGGFRNACSRLRSLEIASGRGALTLNEELL
jgi:hypothetical protein